MGLVRTAEPLGTPISLADAKRQCRIHESDTSRDDEIEAYLAAAVSYIDGKDGILQMCLERQSYDLLLDGFTDNIRFPLRPLISVDEVTYLDAAGMETPLDDSYYTVDIASETPWLVLNDGLSWPTTLTATNAIRISFTAGHDPIVDSNSYTSTVPESLKMAIRLLVAHFFANREAVGLDNMAELPLGLQMLLAPFKPVILA